MQFKPKKSLGQNFLLDKNIQGKIISSCGFKPLDIVLEIGAGAGQMTRIIAPCVKRVYAVELDKSLLPSLEENLSGVLNVKIINEDILKLDLTKIFYRLKKRIKVFGNIPYYITTPILTKLLESRDKIEEIFITVQKEFAQRMVSGCGSKEYGALSCFVQYYTEPEILFFIKRGSFRPSPKVDSALVRLKVKQSGLLSPLKEKRLFKIIRSGFNQRRKVLRNSIKVVIMPEKLGTFFSQYKIDPDIRPEQLSLQDFINLANI